MGDTLEWRGLRDWCTLTGDHVSLFAVGHELAVEILIRGRSTLGVGVGGCYFAGCCDDCNIVGNGLDAKTKACDPKVLISRSCSGATKSAIFSLE